MIIFFANCPGICINSIEIFSHSIITLCQQIIHQWLLKLEIATDCMSYLALYFLITLLILIIYTIHCTHIVLNLFNVFPAIFFFFKTTKIVIEKIITKRIIIPINIYYLITDEMKVHWLIHYKYQHKLKWKWSASENFKKNVLSNSNCFRLCG